MLSAMGKSAGPRYSCRLGLLPWDLLVGPKIIVRWQSALVIVTRAWVSTSVVLLPRTQFEPLEKAWTYLATGEKL